MHNFPDNHVPENSEYHRVSILSWKIRGITNKLQNKQLDSQKTISTPIHFARQVRHKKVKRCSGGIAILVAI